MCLGIPGQLVTIDPAQPHLAVVDVNGVRRQINIELVAGDEGGITVGDWVLIHVGFAMSRMDEKEAISTLEFIKELGSVFDDEMDQIRPDIAP